MTHILCLRMEKQTQQQPESISIPPTKAEPLCSGLFRRSLSPCTPLSDRSMKKEKGVKTALTYKTLYI